MSSPYEIQIKFVDKLISPSDLRKLVTSKVSRFRHLRVWDHERSKYQLALIDFYDETSARKITSDFSKKKQLKLLKIDFSAKEFCIKLSRLERRHELRRARPLVGMVR